MSLKSCLIVAVTLCSQMSKISSSRVSVSVFSSAMLSIKLSLKVSKQLLPKFFFGFFGYSTLILVGVINMVIAEILNTAIGALMSLSGF